MNAFIIEALRTPIGKIRGSLKSVRADDLAAIAIKQLLERTRVDPQLLDDVIFGCVNQAGEDNRNVARMAVLLAGLPDRVPGATVNRLCASGLEAAVHAARAISVGEADLVIAGGVESMTRAPLVMAKGEEGFASGNVTVFDSSLGWRFPNAKLAARFPLEPMGETAENIAADTGITRAEQDHFAEQSHQKALQAQAKNLFADELLSVEIPTKKGPPSIVSQDEGPRADSTADKLAQLPAIFRKGGSVTAGNSSTLNDGAAAMLLASGKMIEQLQLKPLAKLLASAVEGVDPRRMGLGPIPATKKVLQRAGLSIDDIDLFELNEAFAVQALACQRALGIPDEKLNVNGGAIALGHPLGCSGARIIATLAHELRRRGKRYGIATMCIGVGQGMAVLIESVA
jgi:3-oxoadipyl-CoA thiolase